MGLTSRIGEASDYLENIVCSFGPGDGLELDQESWERMRNHILVLIGAPRSEKRAPEGWRAKSKEEKDGLAGACLAFAAMLKEDYGVGKQAALTCITAAYETNEAATVHDIPKFLRRGDD